MEYRKINLELVVFADEADAVVAELNASIDRLEEAHAIFGGGIETAAVEKSGTRRKSALRHTLAAGGAAVAAVKMAGDKIAGAYRKVI
jgi:3-phosphoglycerate kinase